MEKKNSWETNMYLNMQVTIFLNHGTRDLMGYFDYLNYQDMSKQPTKYLEQKKVINFDIIHHKSRGDPLQGSYEGYQTVMLKDLEKYPAPDD